MPGRVGGCEVSECSADTDFSSRACSGASESWPGVQVHPTSTSAGANTLEGGVKIPSSTPATTVHVTLGDTKGLGGPMTLDRVARDRARR